MTISENHGLGRRRSVNAHKAATQQNTGYWFDTQYASRFRVLELRSILTSHKHVKRR